MSSPSRVTLFALLVAVCAVGAGAAIVAAMDQAAAPPAVADAGRVALADAAAAGRPVLVFRSLERDDGQVEVAPLGDTPGRPVRAPLRCDRVYFAAGAGLCLARGSGFAAGYKAKVFGADFRVEHELDVAGVPSRARVSPDGRYGAVTLFVTGHSYAEAGAFSTETTLIDLASGEKIASLEEFSVTRAGRQVTAVDVNFWGVTFARDSDRFYATLATGGKTFLIEGSVSDRAARVIHENVECPSLSPDGTRIAYKRRTGSRTRPWRVTVLDLATMRETRLAEARSVDDQVEWLDDERVLYGVDREVVSVPADGSGQPRRFVARADSPAAVRF